MKPKGEIEMGRHEAYVWDSVSMEWRRMPLYEEGVRSEIRAEVPYAEFMERMGLERKPGLSWAERKRLRELQDRFPRTQAEIRRDRLMHGELITWDSKWRERAYRAMSLSGAVFFTRGEPEKRYDLLCEMCGTSPELDLEKGEMK